MSSKKILFLTAFADETQSVLKFFKNSKSLDKRLHASEAGKSTVYSLETGMGFQNTKYSLEKFLSLNLEVDSIYLVGFCGSLDPDLEVGQVVSPAQVDTQSKLFSIHVEESSVRAVPKILSVDKIIRTSKEKKDYFLQTQCQIVDMESAIIAEIAASRKIPLTIIKSVMDSAEHEIPQNFRQPLEEEKNLLIELKNNMKMAKERLEKDFLESFFDRLEENK